MKRSVVALAVLALAGCSTPLERRQAGGGFDYLEQNSGNPLVVPAGLETPRTSREFDIPALGDQADPELVGPRLDVRPPLQVLPLAPGTRIQDGTDTVTILIESNDDDVALADEIQQTLLGFLGQRGIGVADANGGVITTDWIEQTEVVERSWWRDKEYQLRQRYRFDTVVKDHGRTGSIEITLLDHEERLDGVDEDIVLTDADRRRYAIDMLNSAIAYMAEDRQAREAADQIANGRGFNTELGLDPEDNAAFIADGGFDEIWTRMGKVLPALGFEVRDLDKTLATYYVEYDSSGGFWSSLWSDSERLDLEEGSYQVRLFEMGERTAITLMDSDAEPLSTEQVTEIYQIVEQAMGKEMSEL
ncbi:outer membrane protein assembly factor BamC [Ferrimonas gelatinilytica]|uniref:Outer membrane protein assembly factor BamC n=1 Tax=Ferrimonas gelatinilytica TaxID=1255257 RepID=A0ABP9RZQ3_9GAMM